MAAVTLSTILPLAARITAPATPYEAQEIIVPGDCRSFSVQFLDSAGNPVSGRFAFAYDGLAGGLLADDYRTIFGGVDAEYTVDGRARANAGDAYSLWVACSAASGIIEVVATR